MNVIPTEDEINDALGRIREELSRESPARQPFDGVEATFRKLLAELEELQLRLQYFGTQFQANPDSVYDLADLLAFEDREFVHVAYLALVCRPADRSGLTSYLRLLRAGREKVWILGRIRWSAEGRRVGVTVRGLWLRYLWSRLFLLPFVGWVFDLIVAAVTLPVVAKRARIHSSALFARIESDRCDAIQYVAAAGRAIQALEQRITILEGRSSRVTD